MGAHQRLLVQHNRADSERHPLYLNATQHKVFFHSIPDFDQSACALRLPCSGLSAFLSFLLDVREAALLRWVFSYVFNSLRDWV